MSGKSIDSLIPEDAYRRNEEALFGKKGEYREEKKDEAVTSASTPDQKPQVYNPYPELKEFELKVYDGSLRQYPELDRFIGMRFGGHYKKTFVNHYFLGGDEIHTEQVFFHAPEVGRRLYIDKSFYDVLNAEHLAFIQSSDLNSKTRKKERIFQQEFRVAVRFIKRDESYERFFA